MKRAYCIYLSALLTLALPSIARAQACCAGGAAITPGRLATFEDHLVGLQTKTSFVYGSFDAHGNERGNADGSGEIDFQQDLIGAIRVLERGQVALDVPLVETWRTTRSTGGEAGGGLGDVNLGGRVDLTLAGRSRLVPGIAILGGATLPTGRAIESSSHALATDATGIGAFQGNLGLALEQTFGAWLVSVTGIFGLRAPRNYAGVVSSLGPQLTGLAAAGYVFSNDASIALVGSFTGETDATVDGVVQPYSARRFVTASVAGAWPFTDAWKLQGSIAWTLPFEPLGQNQPASAGLVLTLIRAWP